MYKFLALLLCSFGILSLPLCILFPSAAGAARPEPDLVRAESEFFFGSVSNTEIITHEFIFSNEGTAPLQISAVRTDCGCVAGRLKDDTLAPGESTALKVNFSLKGRSGPQMRRITLISCDPWQPRLTLSLIGEAIAPLEIEPDRIYWGNVYYKSPVEKSCEIRFSEAEQSYINAVEVPTNIFTAETLTIEPRRHYKIVARARPELTIGQLQAVMKIRTDHPRFKTIEIPMQGRIVGDIYAIPEEIVVEAAGQKEVNRVFLVYSGLKKKFKIVSIELPQPEMKANIRPMAAANGYRINLRNITPSKNLAGKNIAVVTDCETMPKLLVPLKILDDN